MKLISIPASLIISVLCACTPPASLIEVARDTSGQTNERSIFYKTTRQPVGDFALETKFGPDHSSEPSFGRLDISLPKTAEGARIQKPYEAPTDLRRQFAVVGQEYGLSRDAFLGLVEQELTRLDTPEQRAGVTVYVHGFNTKFSDEAFKLAKFTTDTRFEEQHKSVPIMFSWASGGNLTAYVADRESVILAEPLLEQLLLDLMNTKADFVSIVAHSMGAHLTMQTLRRISIRGEADLLTQKVGPVFLLAPDIDADVFADQMAELGNSTQPMMILASRSDFALIVSAGLRRGGQRLGAAHENPGNFFWRRQDSILPDLEPIQGTLFDASALYEGSGIGHDLGFSSPTLLYLVNCIGPENFRQFGFRKLANPVFLTPESREDVCKEVGQGNVSAL